MSDEPQQAPDRSFVVREGADIAHWVFIGDIDADEVRRLVAERAAVMAGCTRVLHLVDLSRVGKVTSGARKAGAEGSQLDTVAAAIYGATFQVRVIAKLVLTAAFLFRQMKPEDSPVRFFESEREAWAWLDERRRMATART